MNKLDDYAEKQQKNTELMARVKYQIDFNGETNDWEDEFLESILNRLVNGYTLTDTQTRKLEEIEEKDA